GLERYLTLRDADGLPVIGVTMLDCLALTAALRGQPVRALRLAAAAEAMRRARHARQEVDLHVPLAEALDRARSRLTPDRLPATLAGLVGRQPELARLRGLHRSARLVTLRGPGGAGKTRLALEFANRVRTGYPGGVWLVELGSLGDPALLTQTVATALRVRE